jgi:hypothetical protein
VKYKGTVKYRGNFLEKGYALIGMLEFWNLRNGDLTIVYLSRVYSF